MNKLKLIGLGNKDNRNYFIFKKDNSFFSLFPTFLENLGLDKLGIMYEHSEEPQDINDAKSVKVNCSFCGKEIECPKDMLRYAAKIKEAYVL